MPTMTTEGRSFDRSLAQRMDALGRANDVRMKRAALKKRIKAGKVEAGPVLWEPPQHVETMKVFDLLVTMPKIGRVKANKLLGQCRISPSKTVGGLTVRQRKELLMLVGGYRPDPRRRGC